MQNCISIWHSKRISATNAEIEIFAEPKEYKLRFNYLSIQPASGYTNIAQFGERVSRTWLGIANQYVFNGIFTEGDRLYIDGVNPDIVLEMLNGFGYSANAIIKSVQSQNRCVRLTIEKLV